MPTLTRGLTIRLTAERDAELQALCTAWGMSQQGAIFRAIQEALARTEKGAKQ